MWDVRAVELLRAQSDLVAWWQLQQLGWTRRQIEHHALRQGWRSVHRGIYALCRGDLTRRQRWIAAVLTAPGTWLCGLSGGALHGFHAWEGGYETVVRVGSGGRRRYPGLLVTRSSTLDGQVTRKDGIPVVRAERALVDLAPMLDRFALSRAFREACRLRCCTADSVARALAGQRGTSLLAGLCDRYATIPYHRCRSDAESRGLEILHGARIEPPAVNVKINGSRPDFTWRRHRLIIEIDGAQFHQFADEDARKAARWEAVGFRVRRIPSDDVYFRPERLVALYRANVPHATP